MLNSYNQWLTAAATSNGCHPSAWFPAAKRVYSRHWLMSNFYLTTSVRSLLLPIVPAADADDDYVDADDDGDATDSYIVYSRLWHIGATTVGTGGDWSPTFRLGDQQCIGPPNFLAVVFKKQEISQQVVTRMQDVAFEFSKKFSGGDTPGPSQREGATSSRTQHPARPLARRGAQAPLCWHPNLGSPQLLSRGCAPALSYNNIR